MPRPLLPPCRPLSGFRPSDSRGPQWLVLSWWRPSSLADAFGLARFDMSWTTVERADGPAGRYDFSAYDTLIGLLQRHGVRPCKCSTPCDASSSEASNYCACADVIIDYGNPHYDGGRAPESDEAVAALARWATAAVSRFRGQGVVWEFW